MPTTGTPEPGELRAYPSAARSLAAGTTPPTGETSTLLDNRPVGLEVGDAAAERVFDVFDLVRVRADGGPFPSQGFFIPAGSPVVLNVRPPVATEVPFTWPSPSPSSHRGLI